MRKYLRVWTNVTIKSWSQLRKEYPYKKGYKQRKSAIKLSYIYFIPEMKHLCWKEWTIVIIHNKDKECYYEIDFIDKKLDNGYLFTREMFVL